ncbi:hypothetical protein VSH64_03410 [Amycolatopsis rhabdoformis]|uniref:Uncharacterized protein n=1 Tax=Amycolatopsis rhabdoformis TaxID=1448059 RepID=A0ABZ1ICL8_9PSEU|nr:hypothetical protein [Amycolatopsis rhabdoformis]WSE31165.1 hypothetical protein VSH64_03410 [Amycolatopsis rhabdoformis]
MLGADVTWSPERVVSFFGDDVSGENRHRHVLWYGFGLVEFSWERASRDRPWSGHHLSVQAHRLTHGVTPEPALVERYGPFSGPVAFDDVAAELERRGVELVERAGTDADIREYWQPKSFTSVLVVVGADYGNPGDVYSLSSPMFVTPESRESELFRTLHGA